MTNYIIKRTRWYNGTYKNTGNNFEILKILPIGSTLNKIEQYEIHKTP